MKAGLLLASLLGACSDGTEVISNVNYDSRYGDATSMDIHIPDGAKQARPTVMLIHGGAWRWGDRSNYTEAAERFAAAGYIAATIDYRLVPAGQYPAAVQDCLCALSFLRANADAYGIDPDRIAVSGYSAGGQLSALLGVASDNPAHQPDCEWGPTAPPALVVPGDGVYDFTRDGDDAHDWIKDFLGGAMSKVPDNYQNASPLLQVKDNLPPMLVIHGTSDIVPIDDAESLVDQMRAHGNDVRLLELGGAGHITSATTATDGAYLQAATDMPEAWEVTFDFLAQHMGTK